MTHQSTRDGIRTVCVVVTARPSYARVRSLLRAIKEHPDLELRLIVAASAVLERYGAVIDVMRSDGFEPDASVYMIVEGENLVTMAKSTGLGVVELATLFDNMAPDVVVTVADRYETIATAIAASYLNLPVAHIQGGEVTGSIDEKVRHAVTKLSNLHFVANARAARWVYDMGEDSSTIFEVGCPSIDVAEAVRISPHLDFDPFERYGGVGQRFDLDEPYLVVMQHPNTNEEGAALSQMVETIEAIAALDRPTFWFWPNVDAGSDGSSKAIRQFRESGRAQHIYFLKNMTPEDFLRLLLNSGCIIGNSSVGIRECSYLGVPAVNIGTRQLGRERGPNVLDVPHDRHQIVAAIGEQLEHGHHPRSLVYGVGEAGKRIADHLATVPLTIEKRLTYEARELEAEGRELEAGG